MFVSNCQLTGRVGFPIARVGTERSLIFVSLSAAWRLVEVHYADKANRACTGDGSCPWCRKNMRKQMTAWMFGHEENRRKVFLVNLTPLACFNLKDTLGEEWNYEGSIIKLTRKTRRSNGPVEADYCGRTSVDEPIGMVHLENVLRALYKVDRKEKSDPMKANAVHP